MTDYSDLVKALRVCNRIDHVGNCNECYYGSPDAPPPKQYVNGCKRSMCEDAAAAIEALQAQLPKRGEWIRKDAELYYWHECSKCGERPLYDRYANKVLSAYCPNCGADMRAKMEVQDGK